MFSKGGGARVLFFVVFLCVCLCFFACVCFGVFVACVACVCVCIDYVCSFVLFYVV